MCFIFVFQVLTVDDSEIFSINVVPDSLSQSQGHFKRYLCKNIIVIILYSNL